MSDGSYEFLADGPDSDDAGDARFAARAIAWGATKLGDPPAHSHGIRIELRQRSHPSEEPLAQFSLPLTTARELGIWLATKADSLAR